ncbi:ribosomal protein L7/L12 [Streptomyces roseoverticillatus]|uniref:Ribosomal protein L7/L12 n=1 Tax=Streptomyces roseoverticillatus TaxID=66429 RepID=A0ABV3IVR8_9ACTN
MDMALVFLFPLLGLLAWSIERRIQRVSSQISRLECKADLILEHLGIHEDTTELARITGLARSGQKIQAIKAYRELTGDGLAEAKAAVDRLVAGS